MKYKYEFEADETFSKGCCYDCPMSYFDDYLDVHCPFGFGATRYEIKGVWCLFYFKVNTESLSIDVIAIKEDNRPSAEDVDEGE